MALNRWQAAADLLGHTVTSKSRRYGKTTHYWVVCSCGYESSPGRSSRFAVSAGIGHVRRVADRLREAGRLPDLPDTPSGLDVPHEARQGL